MFINIFDCGLLMLVSVVLVVGNVNAARSLLVVLMRVYVCFAVFLTIVVVVLVYVVSFYILVVVMSIGVACTYL